VNRSAGFFKASLQEPRPATIVSSKILEVVQSGTWQLRHPVGPDALPLITHRQSMSDEDWVDWHGSDDDRFAARLPH
jgi:hypothetical protein